MEVKTCLNSGSEQTLLSTHPWRVKSQDRPVEKCLNLFVNIFSPARYTVQQYIHYHVPKHNYFIWETSVASSSRLCYCIKLSLSTDRLAAQQRCRRQQQTIVIRWNKPCVRYSKLYDMAVQQFRLSACSSSASYRKGPASIPWELVWNLWQVNWTGIDGPLVGLFMQIIISTLIHVELHCAVTGHIVQWQVTFPFTHSHPPSINK
jgi:hypothetical protein